MEYCLRFMKTIEKTSSNRLKVSQGYCTFVSTQPLFEDEAVSQYKQYVTDLNTLCEKQHEATTKVVLEVLKKRVVVQITTFLKDGTADMESLYKKRSDIRLDYDSHLQKTGVYERKNAMEEAMRFHSKARHDNAMLNAFTAYLTRRMEEFVSLGLKLLLLCTTTMVACEFYLTKRQYDALCMMGTNLSEEDVFSITSELTTLVRKVTAGESIEKDIIAPLLEIDPHPPSEYPVYTSYDEWVKKGGEEALSPDAEEFVEGNPYDKWRRDYGSVCDDGKREDGNPLGDRKGEDGNPGDRKGEEGNPSGDRKREEGNPSGDRKREEGNPSGDRKREDGNPGDRKREEGNPSGDRKRENSNSSFENSNETNDQSTHPPPHPPFQVRAVYPFEGTEEGDLSFEEGALITVIRVDESDWWEGELDGKTGIFPSNYVEYDPSCAVC